MFPLGAKRAAALAGVLGLTLLAAPAALAQPRSRMLSADNLVQLSPHTWIIKGFPNIGFVVGSKATLVVDTGLGTPNGEVVARVAQKLSTRGQKLYLTTTHYHAEHAAGEGGFPLGTVVIRPRVQQAELEAEGQKLVDLFMARSEVDRKLLAGYQTGKPGILFDDRYGLDLGGVKVALYWFGPAHTKGDELIMIQPDRVLFSGDVVQNKAGPYFYCADCTPISWLAVLDKIATLKPDIIVPDHSDVGGRALINQERAILAEVQKRALALKAEGKSVGEAAKILTTGLQAEYPGWSGFNHLDLAARQVYAE